MIVKKALFQSRLAGKPIDLGRSPWLKRNRTNWVIDMWENDLIEFDSVFLGESGIKFLILETVECTRPFKLICKLLDVDAEVTFEKGEKVLFCKLDMFKTLTYYKARQK